MEKKIKFGMSARLLVCVVFGVIGILYLLMGTIFAVAADESGKTVGSIFILLGSVFLVVAAILLVLEAKKRAQIRQAVENQHYIWGEIAEIERNPSIRVNGRCPYVVLVRYRDRNGQLHLFRSRNLIRYPDPSIIGKQVRVYYQDETYKIYYVDLDGVLPSVIEH